MRWKHFHMWKESWRSGMEGAKLGSSFITKQASLGYLAGRAVLQAGHLLSKAVSHHHGARTDAASVAEAPWQGWSQGPHWRFMRARAPVIEAACSLIGQGRAWQVPVLVVAAAAVPAAAFIAESTRSSLPGCRHAPVAPAINPRVNVLALVCSARCSSAVLPACTTRTELTGSSL